MLIVSGHFGQEINLLPLSGIKAGLLDCPACSLVTVPTSLFRSLYVSNILRCTVLLPYPNLSWCYVCLSSGRANLVYVCPIGM